MLQAAVSKTDRTATAGADDARFQLNNEAGTCLISCSGAWVIGGINEAEETLHGLDLSACSQVIVDTTRVSGFDTAGAWLVERVRQLSAARGLSFTHRDTDAKRLQLVKVVTIDARSTDGEAAKTRNPFSQAIENFGKGVVTFYNDFIMACYLVGSSIRGPQMKVGRRGGIRFKSIIHHLDQMGLRAVPVIALMSFLIGAIIAQQGAYQLKYYGEELLMVNLVGLLHFREIAVLLTAVMVAGRTGSAITAEIGTMKMREEIDALKVIGLNPIGVLIFPRLVALIIALPMLVLLSDITGMMGAMAVGALYIGIPPEQFLQALRGGVDIHHVLVGLIKAPVMAVIIGLAASVEGLKVEGSAESLGQRTTSSVVRAIFAVIVVDGLFAMFFAAVGY